ncbi:MAG: ABC transporter substrate-binding protein [Thermodesulfobacteriota bacterium]
MTTPRKGRLWWTWFLVLFFIQAAAPAGAETLLAALPVGPDNLDPHQDPDPRALTFIHPCYQRLTALRAEDGRPEPSLAVTWRLSEDGRWYTFVLKEGETFSDGRPVDAEAVLYSFQRTMVPGRAGSRLCPELTGLRVLGPHTVRFILSRPSVSFLYFLASAPASIVSPGAAGLAPDHLDRNSLGSGPYRVESFRPGREITLAARTEAGLKPRIDRFTVFFQPDPDERKEMLCAGQVHLAEDLDPGIGTAFEFETDVTLVSAPLYRGRLLAFNTARSWLDRTEVRRALALVLDSEEPARLDPWLGGTRTAGPPAPARFQASGPPPGAPEEEALLENETADRPARTLALAFDPGVPGLEAQARWVARRLNDLGLEVSLAEYRGPLPRENGYDLLLFDPAPVLGGPWGWLENLVGSGNLACFQDPEVLDLLEQARTASGDNRRRAGLYGRLEEIMKNKVPYVFLYQHRKRIGLSRQVKAFILNPFLPQAYPLTEMDLAQIE